MKTHYKKKTLSNALQFLKPGMLKLRNSAVTGLSAILFMSIVSIKALGQNELKIAPSALDFKAYIYNTPESRARMLRESMIPESLYKAKLNETNSWRCHTREVSEQNDQSKSLKNSRRSALNTLLLTEQEQGDAGTNNTPQTAERIQNFGSRPWQNNRVLIDGAFNTEADITPEFTEIDTPAEDNGSIPLAFPLNFTQPFQVLGHLGILGDGPHGSSGSGTGDFDFYSATLKKGDVLQLVAGALNPETGIDLWLVAFDSEGTLLDFTGSFPRGLPVLRFVAPKDGEYYFLLTELDASRQFVVRPLDLFDSGSGNAKWGEGGIEGDYFFEALFIQQPEPDFYSFELEKGDVFGISIDAQTGFNSVAATIASCRVTDTGK